MKKIILIVLLFTSACIIAQPVSLLPKKYKSKGLGIWFLVSDSIRGVGTTGVMSGRSVDSLLIIADTGNINTAISPLHKSHDTLRIDSATSNQGGYLTKTKFNSFIPFTGASKDANFNNKKFLNVGFLGVGTSTLVGNTKFQVGDTSVSGINSMVLAGNIKINNSEISTFYFYNAGVRVGIIRSQRMYNNNSAAMFIGTVDSLGNVNYGIQMSTRGRVGIKKYPTSYYSLDVSGTLHCDSTIITPVLTNTTATIGTGNIATLNSTTTNVLGNITFTPTVNSSLSGANARIPSHVTANMVFTNTALTSIASANNGGVNGGHTLYITNSTGSTITIVNNYGGAAAGEAINTGKGSDVNIPTGGSFALQYNATNSVWSFLGGGNPTNTTTTTLTATTATITALYTSTLTVGTAILPLIQTISTSTITPDGTKNKGAYASSSTAFSIVNPSTNFADGQGYVLVISDNGVARSITFGNLYIPMTAALPTTTTAGKRTALYFIYDSTYGKYLTWSSTEQ